MRGRGATAGRETSRALAGRITRHVVAGLLTGAAAGYLVALVLPRRYPAPAGSYQAPVPAVRRMPPAASRAGSAADVRSGSGGAQVG